MLSSTTDYVSNLDDPRLYEQSEDWRDPESYPPFVKDLTPADCLRLVWEVMRRSPRYRRHYFRLEENGLLQEDSFTGGKPYVTSLERTRFRGWQSVKVEKHWVGPPDYRPAETMREYITRQTGPWLIMHGHWFVKTAWGISRVASPSTPAAGLDLRDLFSPSAPMVTAVQHQGYSPDEVLGLSPGVHQSVLSPREAIIRVRLDMPASAQLKLAEDALANLQRRLPLVSPKIGRARDLGVRAPLWLRMWDAEKAGIKPKEAKAHLSRSFEEMAKKIEDKSLADDVREWVRVLFTRIKSDGKKVIEDESASRAFFARYLSDGLGAFNPSSRLQAVSRGDSE